MGAGSTIAEKNLRPRHGGLNLTPIARDDDVLLLAGALANMHKSSMARCPSYSTMT